MIVAGYKGVKEIGDIETPANTIPNGNDHESTKTTDEFNEVRSLGEEIGINRPFQALIKTSEGDGAPIKCSTGS